MDEAGKDPLTFLQCLILCLLKKKAWKEEGGMLLVQQRVVPHQPEPPSYCMENSCPEGFPGHSEDIA